MPADIDALAEYKVGGRTGHFLMNAQLVSGIMSGKAIDKVIREGSHEEGHVDRRAHADAGADSWLSATDVRMILYIVDDEGCHMKELNAGSRRDDSAWFPAEIVGHHQR